MRVSIFIGLMMWMFLSHQLAAQKIVGTVADQNGDALIGVNIYIPNTTKGAVSNFDGSFEIDMDGDSILLFSYIGFHDTFEQVNPGDSLAITMIQMEELVICKIPVITSWTRFQRAHSFSKLERSSIQDIQAMAPQEVYNKIPGLFMHSGAANTNRLTIRGIGSRSPFSTTKIRAYFNEVPLTSGIGESNLEDLNMMMVDQVEIYKGPTSPQFGAALGGVIHYRTQQKDRDETSLNLKSGVGSFNSVHNDVLYNYKNDGAIFSLSHSLTNSDGYRDNNNFFRQSISGFAQILFGADSFTSFVNHTRVNAQIPSGLNIDDFNTDPSLAASNWKAAEGFEDYNRTQVGITHQRSFSNNWHTSTTGFFTSFQNDERRPFNVLNQNITSLGTRISIKKELEVIPAVVNFGNEYFHETENWATYETLDQGQGLILSDNFETRNYVNLFVEGEYRFDSFKTQLGLNYNATQYKLEDRFFDATDQSGEYAFEPILSPFFSFSYSNNRSRLYYASMSHGFSPPTLSETLTPDGLLNPDIRPETGWNLEIGTRQDFAGYSIDVAIYNMWVNDLLVADRVTEDQFIGINAGKTLHPGLELGVVKSWEIDKNVIDEIILEAQYQFSPHRFVDFVNQDVVFDGNRLPGNPDQKLYAALTIKHDRWSLQANNMVVSGMYADDANEIEVDGYALANVKGSWDIWRKGGFNLGVSGQVNNVFDSTYASMISVNPRSFGSSLPRYLYTGLPRNFNFFIHVRNVFSK